LHPFPLPSRRDRRLLVDAACSDWKAEAKFTFMSEEWTKKSVAPLEMNPSSQRKASLQRRGSRHLQVASGDVD